MKILAAYRRVLSNRHLGKLLFGEFVSSIGDWLYLVALLIVVYERSADPVVLGIVGAARVLPYVLLSIPAGIVADRFDRRLVLLVTDVARGAIMVLMAAVVALDGPVEAIIALAIVATCFSAFFSPAIGTYIPSLVRDESELGPANSTWSTLDNLAFIIGPAVAGVVIAVGDLTVAFLLNALSFAVVAAVLWRLPTSRAGASAPAAADPAQTGTRDRDAAADEAHAAEEPRPEGAAVASVRDLLRPIAVPLLGLNIVSVVGAFVSGGLGVLTVVIAVDVLASGETGTGLLNAAVGAGGLLGAVVSSALVLRRRQAPPLLLGGIVAALSIAALGRSDTLEVAMLAMAVAAAGSLLVEVVSTTLFQRMVPDAVRGRTLGAMETLAIAAYAAGSFALPVLAGSLGVATVLAASGVLMGASAVIAVPLLGRHAIQAPAPDTVRERLRHVPVFAGIAPARLEAAMEQASVRAFEAGARIIEEGATADAFYVIASGTVEVTQHDPAGGPDRVLRRMGPDEVFGEIGLLTSGLRTASVTAVEPITVVALDGPDFLELVGSGAGLTSRLLDLHRGQTPVGAAAG